MGRFDVLTQIEEKQEKTTPPSAAHSPTPVATQSQPIKRPDGSVKKPANLQARKPVSQSPTLDSSEEKIGGKSKKEAKSRNSDVTTSSRQDVNLRKWRDIIEDTETHNSALRITNEERYEIEDLISELRRKYKIKTSMNEIARLGLLYLIDDFKKDKENALIIKIKKS